MRRPLIKDGVVVNVIVLADEQNYTPLDNHILGPEGGEIGDTWDGQSYIKPSEPEPPPPTVDDIIRERAHRLALGFDYDFGDARGVHHIGTTPQDMIGWDEVSKVASALMALGQTGAQIEIETNTGPVTVTALDWQQILVAAAQFRQPIWLASFALQKMDPIPEDYADDSYWPPAA